MEIDASLLLAIGGIITGVLAFISSRSVDRRAAKRDEVQLLREEVGRLQKRVDELTSDNEMWRIKYDKLYRYVLVLRRIMMDNKIEVPEMTIFNDEVSSKEGYSKKEG
jgi:hypothetical protein